MHLRGKQLFDKTTDHLQVVVGSNNPVKLNATKQALEQWQHCSIIGQEVESGVPAQPMSDAQTRRGARNRARTAWHVATAVSKKTTALNVAPPLCLGVGLEGGVFRQGQQLWSTVWVSVCADGRKVFESNGARFALPEIIAQPILAGTEMGDVLGKLFAADDIKRKQGGIGVVTRNFVTRTQEYTAIATLALGLWYGQGWDTQLSDSV